MAWKEPFTTKSDFAKAEADWIAIAASTGLITTQTGPRKFGRKWLITPRGLSSLLHKWND